MGIVSLEFRHFVMVPRSNQNGISRGRPHGTAEPRGDTEGLRFFDIDFARCWDRQWCGGQWSPIGGLVQILLSCGAVGAPALLPGSFANVDRHSRLLNRRPANRQHRGDKRHQDWQRHDQFERGDTAAAERPALRRLQGVSHGLVRGQRMWIGNHWNVERTLQQLRSDGWIAGNGIDQLVIRDRHEFRLPVQANLGLGWRLKWV